RTMSDLCPLTGQKCVLISDNEASFKNAFRKQFPSMIQLRCHVHLYRNVFRRALKYRLTKEKTTKKKLDEQSNELSDEQIDSLSDEQIDIMIYGYDYIFREHDYCCTKQPSKSITTTSSSSADQVVLYVCETRKAMARPYINDIKYLLSLLSIAAFKSELKIIQQNWSSDFVEYFTIIGIKLTILD
ncbi:unnamed protein product, partial [Didymodactylos carnosus]